MTSDVLGDERHLPILSNLACTSPSSIKGPTVSRSGHGEQTREGRQARKGFHSHVGATRQTWGSTAGASRSGHARGKLQASVSVSSLFEPTTAPR